MREARHELALRSFARRAALRSRDACRIRPIELPHVVEDLASSGIACESGSIAAGRRSIARSRRLPPA